MKKSGVYLGSIILGLNDALVEITGTLAGLTFALQNSKIILVGGFIAGLAASLSMAGSEYLSTKAECNHTKKEKKMKNHKNPKTAAFYTWLSYFLTLLFLLAPYLILNNAYHALIWTLANGILIIAIFSYNYSIEKNENFYRKFMEMAVISLGVSAISFGVGYFMRIFLRINV